MEILTGVPRGKFIVLDGCEGTGKTSILTELKARLSAETTLFVREPGSTPLAEQIRAMLLDPQNKFYDETEHLLFWAARSENVRQVVGPALAMGKNVVSDRFDSSTFAYQVWARGHPEIAPLFDTIRDMVCKDVKPDLYIYLDLDPDIGFERIKGRGPADRMEAESRDFHKRARGGYQEFFRTRPHVRIDAEKPLDEVVREAVDAVLSELGMTVKA